MGSNITFDIIGRDRSGSAAFEKVAKSANRADGAMGRFSAGAMKVAKAGMFALGAGAVVAGKGLYEMAQSAAEDELAQKKLALTLKNTTGATDSQIASVERWITAQGKALGVADDELRPALQRLAEGSGDVAEAQRLASIAMDVSAGTGRSLKTVSEALLRAQNGATGGLSRYGIATKDAKGETLSFEEVTARMARTFEGQAEKAAETTAGKFARLKLILSETGEEIGAKLIPYASDLADAFLDKGVPAIEALGDKAGPVFRNLVEAGGDIKDAVQPAVEEIAEALGNLATEGEGAGQVFNNVFLPALRATAHVVAGVVDFVDDLPGPVKDLGVQAAIAAVVLPKLTGAVQGVTGSVGGFITNMKDAERRTAMFGSAARGAAGVGGMLALVSSAQETDRSLGALKETLGAAGVGGALAGPWGAAIGGAIAVAKNFAENMSQTGERVASTVPPINSMADSLDRLTGSMTATTRVSALENLRAQAEAAGMSVADFADVSGTSVRTLVDASLGGANAMDKVYNGLRRNGEMTTMATHDLNGNVIGYYESMSDGAFAVTKALGGVSRQLQEDKQAAREAALAAQDLTGKLKGIPEDVRVKVKEEGVPVTARGLAQLTKNAHLVPKQIRTLIKAADLPFTVKQILGLQKELDETDKKRPKPKVDADINPFQARDKHLRGLIAGLDKQKPTPKADLDLSAFFNARGTLIASLNSIPDEEVTIWTTRRDRNPGGGPSGGGPDLGYERTIPGLPTQPDDSDLPQPTLGRQFASTQRRALGRSSGVGATSRRTVVEVRNILELDWSKAKTQIKDEVRVIAGEIARDEIQAERNFERQQR